MSGNNRRRRSDTAPQQPSSQQIQASPNLRREPSVSYDAYTRRHGRLSGAELILTWNNALSKFADSKLIEARRQLRQAFDDLLEISSHRNTKNIGKLNEALHMFQLSENGTSESIGAKDKSSEITDLSLELSWNVPHQPPFIATQHDVDFLTKEISNNLVKVTDGIRTLVGLPRLTGNQETSAKSSSPISSVSKSPKAPSGIEPSNLSAKDDDIPKLRLSPSIYQDKQLDRLNKVCSAQIAYNIGSLYTLSNKYHEATLWFYKAINQDPEMALAWHSLAIAFWHQKNWKNSVWAFRRALMVPRRKEVTTFYDPDKKAIRSQWWTIEVVVVLPANDDDDDADGDDKTKSPAAAGGPSRNNSNNNIFRRSLAALSVEDLAENHTAALMNKWWAKQKMELPSRIPALTRKLHELKHHDRHPQNYPDDRHPQNSHHDGDQQQDQTAAKISSVERELLESHRIWEVIGSQEHFMRGGGGFFRDAAVLRGPAAGTMLAPPARLLDMYRGLVPLEVLSRGERWVGGVVDSVLVGEGEGEGEKERMRERMRMSGGRREVEERVEEWLEGLPEEVVKPGGVVAAVADVARPLRHGQDSSCATRSGGDDDDDYNNDDEGGDDDEDDNGGGNDDDLYASSI